MEADRKIDGNKAEIEQTAGEGFSVFSYWAVRL
jgi:hypothetical protein